MFTKKNYLLWVALVVADQATKWIAQLNLSFGKSVYIIPKTLTFDLVHNYGAAYGIFQNQQLFLLTVSVIVIVGGYVFADKIIQTIYSKIGLIFLLAGAFGNFIDRLCLGYVIDFINIYIFPVFNFADIYINIAVLLFVIEMFKHEKNKDNL